jgi:hypothetical protein
MYRKKYMKIFTDAISPELCEELCKWAKTYIYGKEGHHLGFPNPVKTMTNAAWNDSIIKDSKPVIIYFVPDEIIVKIKEELIKLDLITLNQDLVAMVYVWTPGSYIPIHEDGFADTNRKVFTAYLNQDWPIENGGLLHYFSKDANEWKIVKPDQGLLVYNDNNEQHYTTVSHEGHTRISLQMFGY